MTSKNFSCPETSLARQQIVPVVEQVRLARDTYLLRLAAPDLAQAVVPGQFFMIRAPGVVNPLLGRPFALYDTWLDGSGQPAGVDIVYLVVGKMTSLMSGWTAGDRVEIWGPLGNGFPLPTAERLILVAGGIGNTPFPAVAREALGLRSYARGMVAAGGPPDGQCETERMISSPPLPHSPTPHLPSHRSQRTTHSPLHPSDITFCYGARCAEYFAGLDDFAALGIDVRLATDDGSRGHRGFVTDLVAEWLRENENETMDAPSPQLPLSPTPHLPSQHAPPTTDSPSAIYCCGPEPMMYAVAKLAAQHGVPCWLSLETPMACGFGACFSCVTRIKQPDGNWDYRRTCVEGPIFPAEVLAF